MNELVGARRQHTRGAALEKVAHHAVIAGRLDSPREEVVGRQLQVVVCLDQRLGEVGEGKKKKRRRKRMRQGGEGRA